MKIFACAALLLASCGGTQTAGEQAQTPETKTAVKHGPEIALLKPDPKSGMTVNEALQNRRSWREYAPEALSLEELSGVMWAAGGINRPQDGRLTAPSALALYPIRIYAFFPEGVYRYDAKGQKLVRVTEGDHRNLADEAAAARKAVDGVEQAALTSGWDGAWFRRAYDAFGKPVGSKECTEGQIFIEPQGMCVMAGIGKETGQAAQALKSVEERLDTKYGVVLHQPAYTSYQLNLGEISSYPPGYKENAGIFCHNNPWISCAEATLGHGDRAFAVYRKTCPAYIEDISEIHRTEPYVYSQMVAGKDAPTFGEAKNSWLTGTAAWTFFNVSQYILGIQPTLDGLKVDPCIPHTLGGFTVTRRYRGATYHIAVDNTAAVQYGVKSVAVDGKPIEGSLLPLAPEGAVVEVQVTMG